jgi:hypothetical protein
MTELPLADKVVQVHRALDTAGVAHAFGGALALAYYAEPRATVDVDLNIFRRPEEHRVVAAVLEGLGANADLPSVETTGQGRARWGRTPIDLFYAYLPFHDAMRTAARQVPFGDVTIPILSPEHLVVCKAVYDRPKDWLDIEQVLDSDPAVDREEITRWLSALVGPDDARYARAAGLGRTSL